MQTLSHPVWGGTSNRLTDVCNYFISIHPPRVGWDNVRDCDVSRGDISIHPPRVGWDTAAATICKTITISIHPPRVGWDFASLLRFTRLMDFNPPTPCGVGLVT